MTERARRAAVKQTDREVGRGGAHWGRSARQSVRSLRRRGRLLLRRDACAAGL